MSRAPRGSRRMRVISRQAPRRERGERHRRVGQGRMEDAAAGTRPPSARCRSPAFVPGPAAAALGRDVGRQPPGEHRHQRADQHDRRPAPPANVGPNRSHRDGGKERRAVAARPRRPGAGRRAAACRSSTARPTRARDPRAGCARRRRSRRCPPASGRRSARRRRPGRGARRRRSPRAVRTARGGSRSGLQHG